MAALTQRLRARASIGYRLRREFFSDDFSNGIENIASDSQSGFNSPVVIRTVKLKDLPWNGWLRARHRQAGRGPPGTRSPASPTRVGRLVWSTVGDDAYLPVTYNSRWVQNRAEVVPDEDERKPSQSILVPADALMPEADTGRLAPVGAGKGAMGKVVYRVSASAFQDGSEMEPADLALPLRACLPLGRGRAGPARPSIPTLPPRPRAAARAARRRARRCASRSASWRSPTSRLRYRSPVVEVLSQRPLGRRATRMR